MNRLDDDPRKAIYFFGAQKVRDAYAKSAGDGDRLDTDEDRLILLGVSTRLRVLVVCHCFRESELLVRIISARKADKSEGRAYWETKR